MKKGIVIAIDGVSGSGKSTLARELSKKLNFMYLDTGAMYRAITLHVLHLRIKLDDEDNVVSAAGECSLKVEKSSDGIKVFINGEDVSEKIREPYVSDSVSIVSKIKGVRDLMVDLQRKIAADNNIVVEGRDIGTVVFPDARIKFFLDASPGERAKRRAKELTDSGIDLPIIEVLKNIEERDDIDSHRDISPLKKADDAIVIDSTDMSVEQKTRKALEYIQNNIDASEY